MLHSIYVTLVITLSPVTVELDINPTFLVDLPINNVLPAPDDSAGFHGFTLPHLIILDESTIVNSYTRARLLEEELTHAKQWSALGPWYPIAYAATLGRPFEPYDPVDYWLTGVTPVPDNSTMWVPDVNLAQRCPLLRLSSVDGFKVLPCWFSE